ncbi:MAG: hypothetical protein AB1552_02635 [Nitrospirota bacterium]
MKIRTTITFLAAVMLALSTFYAGSLGAEETLRDVLARKFNENKDICKVVKNAISEGLNTKEVVKTCILMGHDACLVVKCGIEAEGSLEQIITGALEAGTTSDVCSRCAIEAGIDPGAVAEILETGLGYSPALAGGLTPVEIGLPGGAPGGGTLSPASPSAP